MAGVKGQPTPGNPNIKDYGFGGKYSNPEREKEIWAKKKKIIWTKDKCVSELNDILQILKKVLKDDEKINKGVSIKLKDETVRDCITLQNKILDYMKYLYPPVQQNVNVNIDMTAETVIERLKEYKSKEVVVFGEKKDAQE